MSRPVGHIKNLGQGRWRVYVTVGKDGSGKWIRKHRTVSGTKRDAQLVAEELRSQYASGMLPVNDRLTVGKFLVDWLHASPETLAPTSLRARESICRLHLIPLLGSHTLAGLRPQHCEAAYRALAERGFSATTVKGIRTHLVKALNDAVRWGLAPRNVAAISKAEVGGETPTPKYLAPEDAVRLLDRLKGTPMHIPAALGIYAGLRRGEVLGLQWRDIDLAKGTLTVARNQIRGRGNVLTTKLPKSGKPRQVSIPHTLVEVLRDARDTHALYCEELEIPFTLTFPVVHGLHNEMVHASKFDYHWQKAAPGVNFHALRHTHATLLLLAGTDVKTISERLGHSSIQITLDVYSHVLEEMDRTAAVDVENVLEKVKKQSFG